VPLQQAIRTHMQGAVEDLPHSGEAQVMA